MSCRPAGSVCRSAEQGSRRRMLPGRAGAGGPTVRRDRARPRRRLVQTRPGPAPQARRAGQGRAADRTRGLQWRGGAERYTWTLRASTASGVRAASPRVEARRTPSGRLREGARWQPEPPFLEPRRTDPRLSSAEAKAGGPATGPAARYQTSSSTRAGLVSAVQSSVGTGYGVGIWKGKCPAACQRRGYSPPSLYRAAKAKPEDANASQSE